MSEHTEIEFRVGDESDGVADIRWDGERGGPIWLSLKGAPLRLNASRAFTLGRMLCIMAQHVDADGKTETEEETR